MLDVTTRPEEIVAEEFFAPFLPRAKEFFDFFDPIDLFAWPALYTGAAKPPLKIEQFVEGEYFVVRAEIPGVDPEKDVQVTLAEGGMYIRAERRKELEEKRYGSYFSEWRYGAMTRFVPLPKGVTEKAVKASYKDGILELRIQLPKETPALGTVKIPIAH